MDLIKLYHEVEKQIQLVDTQMLWDGFQPLRFALYDEENCCFGGKMVEKSPEFLANTSIEYLGEQIAIWNVDGDCDPIILASKLIHEMFHGFQHIHGESRFPNELHALHTYRYTDENLSIKLQENRLLVQLAKDFSPQALSELLSLRKYRAEHFPDEFLYEAEVEQIEGSATYVELNALKSLAPEYFQQQLASICERIIQPSNLLPVRIISYDIGALLLHILKQNGISFPTAFEEKPFAVSLLDRCVEALPYDHREMSPYIDSYFRDAYFTIRQAKAKNNVVLEGETALLGVNVYNAVYFEGHILTKFFVMYGSEQQPTVDYGDFLVETPSVGVATKIYRI